MKNKKSFFVKEDIIRKIDEDFKNAENIRCGNADIYWFIWFILFILFICFTVSFSIKISDTYVPYTFLFCGIFIACNLIIVLYFIKKSCEKEKINFLKNLRFKSEDINFLYYIDENNNYYYLFHPDNYYIEYIAENEIMTNFINNKKKINGKYNITLYDLLEQKTYTIRLERNNDIFKIVKYKDKNYLFIKRKDFLNLINKENINEK